MEVIVLKYFLSTSLCKRRASFTVADNLCFLLTVVFSSGTERKTVTTESERKWQTYISWWIGWSGILIGQLLQFRSPYLIEVNSWIGLIVFHNKNVSVNADFSKCSFFKCVNLNQIQIVDSLLFYLIYNRVGILVIRLIHWKANDNRRNMTNTHFKRRKM